MNVTCDTSGFPAVYLVEAMAQLGGVAVGNKGEGGFLAAIDSAELLGSPLPGDRLRVTVKVVKSFGRLHMMEGEVVVDSRLLARAAFTLGMGKI